MRPDGTICISVIMIRFSDITKDSLRLGTLLLAMPDAANNFHRIIKVPNLGLCSLAHLDPVTVKAGLRSIQPTRRHTMPLSCLNCSIRGIINKEEGKKEIA